MSESNKPYKLYVKLSSDYYHAYLTVDADHFDFRLTKEEIIKALAAKKVTFGLNPNAIEYIINNPDKADNIEVATGIEHEHGVDSKIIYEIDTSQDFKAAEKEDGTVDFKATNFVQTVKKGQVLAYKTEATPGKTGTTVTGMAIKAKDGKLGNFKFGKNVELSEVGMQILAACDGTIKMNGVKVSVIEVLEIFSDVGVKTGNISFSGRIIIRGNVTNGYKVETADSIEIYGVVEAAEILAGGDIIISGGVQGNDDCIIKAGGDIRSNYFNNCEVVAGGNIITDSLMHCKVVCDESITAKGRKGLILGGEYTARHHVIAKTIGTEIGTITKLQLGITNDIMLEFQELAANLKDYKANVTKLKKAYDILSKQKKVKPDDPKINQMYETTKASLDDYNVKLKTTMVDFKNINELIENLKGVYVKADTVYPGVRVKIGNSHYSVKSETAMAKIIKDHGEIILTTY
ncbi:DUF342 domain-containing protein [Acidaminobacter sp. JC074]|uniref:DUF342 domain-containing protein n=1 Tax=Acidaminobacter sp. JC074 TaxID=2530199 RepID=UPI001F0D8956|nr:FapA family protein [Acidaminobacter sp. JC074]MCH4888749.1 DUF342 domain-containing protein [Acidaminobacter sp. JC074]